MSQTSSPRLRKSDSTASAASTSGFQVQYGANVSSDDESSKKMNISLILEAKDLPNMDKRGKSDPFVVVYQKTENNSSSSASIKQEQWKKIGQTETVYNNLNPKWAKTFPIEYSFGSNSTLRFEIYDRDVDNHNLADQDYIGQVKCTVAQIVLADNQRLTLQIHKKTARPGAKTGTLTIRGEEEKGDLGDTVVLQFAVSSLRRGKKPFYILSRKNRNDEEFSPVVYSEVHQSYNGPHQITSFKPITKSLSRLVNGDMDRELQIEFMDFDRLGRHYRGGKTKFTLKAAKTACSGSGNAKFHLKKKKSNGQMVDAGILFIRKCDISIPFSFLDYIQSGVVINTIVAVDMSNSNGNPRDPNSLHYNNPSTPNEYAIALREVGGVLAAYDTDNQFPAFGFGAALPPEYSEPDHCFALTGYIMQPVVTGINGVVEMYYNALNHVAPFTPCYYGPVLEKVIRMTKEEEERSSKTVYTVLLLVTDGEFDDYGNVADLICSAADLPLSIVIVGVGNSRFLNLEKLDGDKTRLCSSDGTPCSRDIVQFVQFHKHRHNPTQLVKEVLDEIPEQLVSYMRSKNMKPKDVAAANPEGAPGGRRNPRTQPYVPRPQSAGIGIAPQSQPMPPQHPSSSIDIPPPSLPGSSAMNNHFPVNPSSPMQPLPPQQLQPSLSYDPYGYPSHSGPSVQPPNPYPPPGSQLQPQPQPDGYGHAPVTGACPQSGTELLPGYQPQPQPQPQPPQSQHPPQYNMNFPVGSDYQFSQLTHSVTGPNPYYQPMNPQMYPSQYPNTPQSTVSYPGPAPADPTYSTYYRSQ